MAITTDLYYIRIVSGRLERFVEKSEQLFTFRCPICGDSHKSKSKARGYFYRHKKAPNMAYFCHNCGASMLFPKFLKEVFPDIYQEYVMEEFKKGKVGKQGSKVSVEDFHTTVDKDRRFSIPEHTQRIAHLKDDHPAKTYLIQRKIPKEHFSHLFYAPDFKEFIDQYDLNIDAPTTPRIIIPFYDHDFNLKGFQGRSMPWNVREVRYITIKLDEDFPKLYGLHRLDDDIDIVYVTEGPIDSLFLPNALAMMGADLSREKLTREAGVKQFIFVLDNEPRSKAIKQRLTAYMEAGENVVIWPTNITFKDINEGIIQGYTQRDIQDIIKSNTYQGLKAKLAYMGWAK